jgi:hypothetical protein
MKDIPGARRPDQDLVGGCARPPITGSGGSWIVCRALLPSGSAGGRLLTVDQRTLAREGRLARERTTYTDGAAGCTPEWRSAVAFHVSPATGTSAGMASIRVVPGMVRAKSAPNAAAGLTAPDAERASVSSTARMLAAAVKA